MKYNEWLAVWFENYITPNVRRRTAESYQYIIKTYIGKTLGETELSDLKTLDIQRFVTGLLTSGRKKSAGGLAASSVNAVITVIRSSLKTAMALGYVRENAACGVRRPKIRCTEVSCFTLPEQRKIEAAALADRRQKMRGIVICLYTGLRIGELLALTWADVDLPGGTLTVSKTCHDRTAQHGVCRSVNEPKTTASKRTIPLPKQLLPLMKAMKKEVPGNHVISHHTAPVSIRSYQRSFASLLRKAGVGHRGFHALRHTFATRAIECGMDVKTLSEILGHKNPTVTLARYAHSLTEHKSAMMNRVGKLFLQ